MSKLGRNFPHRNSTRNLAITNRSCATCAKQTVRRGHL